MLIRPVNNKENINFGAKVKIKYVENSSDKLSKDCVNSIKKYAEGIGSKKDKIEFILGKCKSDTESWSEMGHRYTATRKSRPIIAKSNIDNNLKEEYIGYWTEVWESPEVLAADKIYDYLRKLYCELKLGKQK